MKNVFNLSVALLISGSGLWAQLPAPAAVFNPASNIPAGFPNSGIAQGSIFVVYGKNLGPVTLAQAQAVPLPTTAGVGGTSVQIKGSDGTTVAAPMIYSSATQVAGILPSNVAVGAGTLTVTFNGQSGPTPIQVVATNFGISTINQTGGGPAVVTFPNYTVVTATNSAKPGDTLLLWGTGLGPIPGGDAIVPTPVDLGTAVKVYVGGVAATVTYRGRSAAPGLDQINFVVPPGVSGCYVSLLVQTGNTVSNSTTMPIAPAGGACSDANGIPLNTLSGKLTSQGFLNIGSVTLGQNSISLSVLGQTISSTTTSATATFSRFTAAQLASSPSLFGIPSVGSCTVYNFTGTNTPNIAAVQALGLNAGTAITVTTPSGTPVSLTQSGGSTGTYTAPPSTSPGALPALTAGTYAIAGKGGADVGAFNTNLNLSAPLVWTNQTAVTLTPGGLIGTVNRSAGLPITWSGGDPTGFAVIAGFSTGGTSTASLGGYFLCVAPIAPDAFTVPPAILLALPPTPSSGVGVVLVGASSTPQAFTAPGLDYAVAAASSTSGASVLFQ